MHRGKDGDFLDVFIGPHLDCELVYVINQVEPATGKFDEHKCVVGAQSAEEAREIYEANYQKGWQGFQSVKAFTLNGFRQWVWKKGSLRKAAGDKSGFGTCVVCKEPWSECLGRHGSKPCACGSGKPRNRCDCPGGTPDKEAADARKRDFGDLAQLKEGDLLDFVIQAHRNKYGLHHDVRFGNPELGLYSWASRKDLPLPGAKTLLNQTPLHAHSYGSFQGQLPGGRVERKRKGKIKVGPVADDKIHFSTEEDSPQQFVMLRPPSFKERRWLLLNRTPPELVKGAGDWLHEVDD